MALSFEVSCAARLTSHPKDVYATSIGALCGLSPDGDYWHDYFLVDQKTGRTKPLPELRSCRVIKTRGDCLVLERPGSWGSSRVLTDFLHLTKPHLNRRLGELNGFDVCGIGASEEVVYVGKRNSAKCCLEIHALASGQTSWQVASIPLLAGYLDYHFLETGDLSYFVRKRSANGEKRSSFLFPSDLFFEPGLQEVDLEMGIAMPEGLLITAGIGGVLVGLNLVSDSLNTGKPVYCTEGGRAHELADMTGSLLGVALYPGLDWLAIGVACESIASDTGAVQYYPLIVAHGEVMTKSQLSLGLAEGDLGLEHIEPWIGYAVSPNGWIVFDGYCEGDCYLIFGKVH